MAETSYLLGGRLQVWQTPELYSPSEDAVWLAAAAATLAGTHFFEAGFGTGAAGLCLLTLRPDIQLTAIEKQPMLLAAALRNAALNKLETRLEAYSGDVLTAKPLRLAEHSFSNPPFHVPQKEQQGSSKPRDIAHARPFTLDVWLSAMACHTQPEGALVLITHASDSKDLRQFAHKHGYGLQLVFLHSHPTRPCKRVLARLQRGTENHESRLDIFEATLREKVLRQAEPLFCWRS